VRAKPRGKAIALFTKNTEDTETTEEEEGFY
jgi:hypothetical protein